MLQTIKRQRRDKDLPVNPNSLLNLKIPDAYTIANEMFLLYDPRPGCNRIVILSTAKNLELLERSEVMHMDGTFHVVPPLFSQLHTLQGMNNLNYSSVLVVWNAIRPYG